MRPAMWVALAVFASGCTFGGLADYEVEACTPNPASQRDDVCDRLNQSDPSSCTPWQCDPATRRCAQRLRDDDKDGDPAAACGGADCDDHDAQVSSGKTEVCDGKDNDCDGQVDEAVIGPGTPSRLLGLGSLSAWADPWLGGASGRDLVATWVTPSHCLEAVRLQTGGGYLAPECAFAAEQTLAPRQPEVALFDGAAGAVMVTTSGGCSAVRYAFGSGAWTQDCATAAPGAALPSLAAFAAPHTVLVTWYAVDEAARDNPISSCEAAGAADLRGVVLSGTGGSLHAVSSPSVLLSGGTSVRPAALASVGEVILAAAPSADGITVRPIAASGAVGAPVVVEQAAGARAVVMAAAPDGVHLAIAAELGCTPQSIGVAFGTWDAGPAGLQVAPMRVAAPSGSGIAVQPSVAWVDARREWLVTFIAEGPVARAQRFAADGAPVGEAFDVGAARAALAAADGNVYELVETPDAQLVQMPVGCKQGEDK